MLNLRNTRILLLLTLAALIYMRAPWYAYVVAGVAFLLVFFWGSYHIGSGFYIPVVCHGPAEKKEIALSFDDGPTEQYTPEILEILKGRGVEAVFFCIGANIQGREAVLRKTYDDGHVIGNHSFSHHLWFDLFSTRHMQADLAQMDEAVRELLGVSPHLFRPPYGVTNPTLARAIRRRGYTPVGWNVRSLDTVINKPVKLGARVRSALRPGAIFLFHDTSASTLSILPGFIDAARAAGYTITRLDKMCNLTPYV